jgi:hypothetical protein
MKSCDLRVIHLPFITGNSAWYLSKYEKPLVSTSVVSYFSYSNKLEIFNELNFDIKIEFTNSFHAFFKILKFYLWSIPRFDIFHFNAGISLVITPNNRILDFIDLRLLKLFNKKIVVTYQGSSGRLKNTFLRRYDQSNYLFFDIFGGDYQEEVKQRRINLFNKYSNYIYCTNPDLLYNFNPSKSSFRPYTKMDLITPKKKVFNQKLKIAHFPTNRLKKGSDIVENIISQIMNEGYDIEFSSISGLSYKTVRELIDESDILIDQLIIGWYGGIAIEAMNYGVPVVSYINPKDLKFIPANMRDDIPIINANYESLKSVLIDLIENPNKLSFISDQGYRFISKWHNPKVIAASIVDDYTRLFSTDKLNDY